jgi:hypothetical protein
MRRLAASWRRRCRESSASPSARTSFWDALVALRDNKTTREKAVETIPDRYVRMGPYLR